MLVNWALYSICWYSFCPQYFPNWLSADSIFIIVPDVWYKWKASEKVVENGEAQLWCQKEFSAQIKIAKIRKKQKRLYQVKT